MSWDLFTPTIEDARTAMDRILPIVEKSAGELFNERARAFVLSYLRANGSASGEDITDAAKSAGITPPTSDKAFGPVILSLSRNKLIEKDHSAPLGPRRKGHASGVAHRWKLKAA